MTLDDDATAVVLAAGEGTRLAPLTNVRPKPMLPVGEKPLLEHILEAVSEAGVRDVVLVVGHRRERVQRHFGDGSDWDLEITYAVQEPRLGTGDAVLQAEPYVGGDFVALNGDRVIAPEIIERVYQTRVETGDTAMAVVRVDEPGRYGVVEVADGEIVDVEEKPTGAPGAPGLINAGVYGFGPEIFAAIRRTETHGERTITATLRALVRERPVRPVQYSGPWLDVSYPWDLLTVNAAYLGRRDGGPAVADSADVADTAALGESVVVGEGASVRSGVAVSRDVTLGNNVRVDANAVVSNAVVMADASIGPSAVVRDCVVGENATVGPNVTVGDGAADVVLGDSVYRDLRFGGVIGDNAAVSSGVTVEPGAVLGDGVSVDPGTVVSGRIDPNATVKRG